MAIIPNEERKYTQPNSGQYQGSVFASYGVDFSTDPGLLRVSPGVKQVLTQTDNADFDGYAAAIKEYNGKIYAVSDFTFQGDSATDTTWTKSTIGTNPDSSYLVVDAEVFNNLLLVSEATAIKAWNGSTWVSWWTTTLGQSSLTSGKHIMKKGSDGNLYLSDNLNKLYKVDTSGTVTKTGQGSLDFSATDYEFTCMETTSSRLWIGTKNSNNGEAVIIEWDMSPSSISANRIHNIGSIAVSCIAIWNDTPIAVLRNGKVKYYNGSSFVDFPNIQFPTAVGDDVLLDDFIHKNGWAIIDNLPHFLVSGGLDINSGSSYTDDSASKWNMPSGVYCLDPEVGLYHRFSVGLGSDTQDDYGQMALKDVGALHAVESSDTKFLASYEAYNGNVTGMPTLAYHDIARTDAARAFMATSFINIAGNPVKEMELLFKKLSSGEQINVWQRTENTDPILLEGTWYSNTQLNTTSAVGAAKKGDLAFVKNGAGSGQLLKVLSVVEGASVNEITFTEAAIGVSLNEQTTVAILDFKHVQTITSNTVDFQQFNPAIGDKKRKTQFLFEYRQAAGSTIEHEYSIIST